MSCQHHRASNPVPYDLKIYALPLVKSAISDILDFIPAIQIRIVTTVPEQFPLH